ncbi:MAG: hypothetical protein HY665_04110 [Chloroflexi bacterium]|nr:hypothetical protein [Chloroflexota bacterium]
MLLTVLEATVTQESWPKLEKAYKEQIQHLEAGISQTFLLHDTRDTSVWRIATIWKSREALDEMRKLGTPKGVIMFREAGAEPKLNIFDIVAQAGPAS